MADNFRIQLGLPVLPPDDLPPQLADDFKIVYTAIQNLLRGVSQYCGVDAPTSDIWSQTIFADTLLIGNLYRMYVPAGAVIARGQVVNLYNNAGVLNARLAQANSATTMAHGVANTAGGIGSIIEVNFQQSLIDSIGGLTVGALYYLSPSVAGAVTATRPSTVGQIIQSVGLALTPGQMALNIPLQYQQL